MQEYEALLTEGKGDVQLHGYTAELMAEKADGEVEQ